MQRAIIYTRVSTDEQAKHGYSLRHQSKVLEVWCAANKIDIIGHFEDDHSAKDFNRPEFNKMMDFIKENKGDVDLVLFTKWDRFSRNQEEAYAIIRKLKAFGVSVNAAEQPLDLTISDNKVLLAIYLAIPEVENDKISERTIDGQRRAQKEGCHVTKAPFGYDKCRTPLGKSSLKPNDNAKLVLKAYKLFSKGIYTAEEVRRRLRPEGMKMNKQNFSYLLRNSVYNGKITIKPHGKEEEQTVDGLHEAIINDHLFNKVQEVLQNRRTQPLIKKRQERYPLRGYLLCPKCDRILTASASRSRSGARYDYYHCQDGCKTRFRADLCNGELYQLLQSFEFKPEIVELFKQILFQVYNEKDLDHISRIKTLNEEIKSIEKNIEKAEDKLITDAIDDNAYKKISNRYSKLIQTKKIEILELKSLTKEVKRHIDQGLTILSNLHTTYFESTVEIKQKILGSIFPGKLIFNGKNYRTAKMNEVIFLMTSNNKHLERGIKKQTAKNSDLSNLAPLLGLEPRTL